jgi:outer membrane protein OmpA-like peptidoglycan-associated protein
VKKYLVDAGMEPGVISVKGFGQTSPLAKGTSDAARARNRRVEIVLTDTKIKFEREVR